MQRKPEKNMCGVWRRCCFRAGDTTCEDRERSGRPLVVDDDQIKSLIESNPYMTREIAEIIDVSQKTVVNHLHTLDCVSRYDIWVPHNLSDKNLMDRKSLSANYCSNAMKTIHF